MRNLKRALSLAIASVMLLGMMVVGAGASSYPDVDASDNLESIEVLKMVGVMVGDEKGNFNGDAFVSRAEMAVIMYNLLGLKAGGSHPFTDVPAWAVQFVAACYNNGTVAGTSATTYGSDAQVTAAQAALMIMKALGYFSFQGEFGEDWSQAVMKQANKIGLFDGIAINANTPMTRNEIAKLVLNALESTVQVVEQHGGLTVSGNGITVVENPTYTYADVVDKSNKDYNDTGWTAGTQQLCEKLFGFDLKKLEDSQDDFGRPCASWTYKGKAVKTPEAATLVYTAKAKYEVIFKDLGKPVIDFAELTVDGAPKAVDEDDFKVGNDTDLTGTGKGVVTEVYYDSSEQDLVIVCISTYLAKATADYDSSAEELEIEVYAGVDYEDTLSADDFAIAGYEKDDYLLVTICDEEIKSVAPATVLENVKVSGVKAGTSVVAAGTKYDFNDTTKAQGAAALNGKDFYTSADVYSLNDTTYTLYLDQYGYIVGVETYDEATTLNDYLFVKDVAKSGFTYTAKVVFMDGTSKTITVSKTAMYQGSLKTVDSFLSAKDDEGEPVDRELITANGQLNALQFYTFTIKDGNYQLTAVKDERQDVETNTTIANGSAKPVVGAPYTANNATVFVADDVAYVGVKNAPKVKDASNVYILLDKDANYMMAAYTAEEGVSAVAAADYVYIMGTKSTKNKDSNDNVYYTYDAPVIKDGKIVKGSINVAETHNSLTTGLYEITSYTDGYADLEKIEDSIIDELGMFTDVAGANIGYKNGVIKIDGNSYVLADDVVIYSVDVSKSTTTAKEIATSGLTNLKGEYDVYVIQKSSSDEIITRVYVVKTSAGEG